MPIPTQCTAEGGVSDASAALDAVTRAEKTARVRVRLLAWFATNRRDLPWRQTRDPYRILVSEVMLQQTQVDRVVSYYNRFLERFPTVVDLAAAPTADVIRAWAGLGYNRRAVNLQRTAQSVVDDHGGEFPRSVDALRALPGIGAYTAGAVACFAFEQDVGFIDTNIRRVIHRLFAGVDVPTLQRSERELAALAARLVPPNRGWEWNQGVIEFGALQCTARRPACVVCPLQADCLAYPAIQTAIAELPRGTRTAQKREAPFAGSNRYYRGQILARLRDAGESAAGGGIPLHTLGPLVREGFSDADVPWLYGVVQGLAKDGLAKVAEAPPSYDPSEPLETTGEVRVELP
ncbi:MAG: A/G-specific adenine glycosylase [uncultured Thermomicrobiales bacterium]|uniref:Adenine DNA glycosylase n=1 Tax=uncultured Thermomicrobiales bacterium TaxID=1645740 RepID=A0A6J4UNS1_9BACT|nr:MAG: A/G-specific adenine glycosylase [uncultured Thermomicrobiales bacterium]